MSGVLLPNTSLHNECNVIEVDEEAEEEVEEYEEIVDEEAEEAVEDYEDELDEEYDEAYDEDLEVMDEEIEEAEVDEEESTAENEQLKLENEQLEQDLQDEEHYANELQNELDEMEEEQEEGYNGDYVYEDDMFGADYWDAYDWNSVWGDYACEDLFNADIAGQSYDPEIPAGHDTWPTIRIYGACNSCQAYIMDYYSTEHFVTIQMYDVQSWVYLMIGFFMMIVAAISALKQYFRPAIENEVILLTNEGGVPA
jgi:hypothetical protein